MLFKDPNIDTVRQMRLNILKFSYEGLQKEMPAELFTEALAFVNETLKLPVSPRTFEIILASDGYAYANIIEFGVSDTETTSSISNAIAKHYMNRGWPTYEEEGEPGVDDFEERLLMKVKQHN